MDGKVSFRWKDKEQKRLQSLATEMPGACRAISEDSMNCPDQSSQEVLLNFITNIVDGRSEASRDCSEVI